MKKKIVLRGMLGIPIGLAIGYVISIIMSAGWANGEYIPCEPQMIDAMGSEIQAVILQAFLCGMIGFGFSASSVVWDIEKWGLVKQTGIYFLILSVIMLPIAYATYWMEHSLEGFLSYFGIFVAIFAVIWVVEYMIAMRNVKKLNEKLHKR